MSECPLCRAPLDSAARYCGGCGRPVSEPAGGPYRALIGREVGGRYRVLEVIGEGGMGAVFRAEQLSLRRTVALKILRPELSRDAALVRRFNAEAELAARLTHPNTVTLFDFGQDADGALFIAMEFLEGRSLRHLLGEGPLPALRAIAIAEQIAASLGDAHSHGIVHRDLKPDNVMLIRRGKTEDVVRVVDFGIAKLRGEGGVTQMALTQVGDMLGTPQYMAPEQIRGDKVDARTDIYALGAVLYEMVTGRPPFEDATLTGILARHLTEVPMSPSVRRPDLSIPKLLETLIMAALQKEPHARPPSMEAITEQFAALRRELGSPRKEPLGLYSPLTPPHGLAALPKTVKYDQPPVAVPENLRQARPSAAPPLGPTIAPVQGGSELGPTVAPFQPHAPVALSPSPGSGPVRAVSGVSPTVAVMPSAGTPRGGHAAPPRSGPGFPAMGQPPPSGPGRPSAGLPPYAGAPPSGQPFTAPQGYAPASQPLGHQPGFAHLPSAKPAAAPARPRAIPIWTWVVAAVVLGGLLGALVWWTQREEPRPAAPAAPAAGGQPAAAPPARPSSDFSITPSRPIYGEPRAK